MGWRCLGPALGQKLYQHGGDARLLIYLFVAASKPGCFLGVSLLCPAQVLDVKPKSIAAAWQPWHHRAALLCKLCPWGTAETSQVECSDRVHAIRMGGHQASPLRLTSSTWCCLSHHHHHYHHPCQQQCVRSCYDGSYSHHLCYWHHHRLECSYHWQQAILVVESCDCCCWFCS